MTSIRGDGTLRVGERSRGNLAVADVAAPAERRFDGETDSAIVDRLEPPLTANKKKLSRVNSSLIALLEARAIAAILPNLPAAVSPMHLTILGLLGAGITSISLIACTWSMKAVVFVPLGLFVHWFGDSLDGSLARYRRIERPSFGFFVDHSIDLFAMSLMIISFGFSPFLTLTSALMVLATYLLFSAYTYVEVAVEGVHQLAYGGLGCTEFRLIMGGWSIAGAIWGPPLIATRFHGVAAIDVVIGVLSVCAVCALACIAWQDMRRIDRLDRKAPKSA